jgi:ubiquinone/menaquinone biosynthesis C-methylase UbiE
MHQEPTFFDFAAEVGLTKHIGGREATEVLLTLCHIDQGRHVLDIGCGVGVTPCFIATRYGSRVAGVDISERMIERSRERAEREGVAGRVAFGVADAQDLPFADAVFDAVITESVTAFPEDKQKAVDEYARVTKPGGYVGLNESVWWKVPVPPEVVAWAAQDIGASVQPLTVDAWKGLLENAGLQEVTTRTFPVDTRVETRGILQRYGWQGMLRVFWRMMLLYGRSPAYRRFVGGVQKGGLVPANLAEYFGYGLFVGQKP